jgi:hypothetical protein
VKTEILFVVAGLAVASLAQAQSRVSLESLTEMTWQQPRLRAEIEKTLAQTGLSETAVPCVGTELGGEFGSLRGTVIAPFVCDFGSKKLLMEASVNVVVGVEKINLATQRAKAIEALAAPSSRDVFLYQVLTGSRWVRN